MAVARRFIHDACNGLVAAHKARLLHRDIKPENILVRDEDDEVKLADFGISSIILQITSAAATVAGTYPYMAPEAFQAKASFQSDIWSLSVTLYEMVTGRLPFYGRGVLELKESIEQQEPVPANKVNPRVDKQLNDVITQGLQKSPSRRFASAQEMLSALKGPNQQEEELERRIAEARELFNGGDKLKAEKLLKELLDRYPSGVKLYLALGELYNRCQQYEAGEQVLRTGVSLCPQHAAMHFYLAMVLERCKKRSEATQLLERALKLGLGASQKQQAAVLLRRWKESRN